MESITLKEIASYLAYGLKFRTTDHYNVVDCEIFEDLITLKNRGDYYFNQEDNEFLAEPILYPLSMLTQEIEHNGEKFVPIVELAKISFKKNNWKQNGLLAINERGFHFWYDNGFIVAHGIRHYNVENQLDLFQKLYEWHFDVHGLIERGLAIDKQTIKT